MKKQLLKKHVAIIIAIMMFSFLPEVAAAQSDKRIRCGRYGCPIGYICVNGYCKRYFPLFTDNSSDKDAVPVFSAGSNASNIQLIPAQQMPVKMYDLTGRPVIPIADSWMSDKYHQIRLGAKD